MVLTSYKKNHTLQMRGCKTEGFVAKQTSAE